LGTVRIGALISGSGSNLKAIIDACRNGRIPGEVVFVGSDKPSVRGLEIAEASGIATFVVNYQEIISSFQANPRSASLPDDFRLDDILSKQHVFGSSTPHEDQERFFKSRAIAEAKLLKKMWSFDFDLVVLAGFMRVLTPYFIDKVNANSYLPRIMNIHPAILPAFPGVDGYGDTYRYGCKVAGSTVHFVDYGEDSGPIIGQKTFDILPGDTLNDVRKKGLELEWKLYPECIRLFSEGRLNVVQKTYPLKGWRKRSRMVVEIH
jgi:phosphoribosylglycinamide formyltransferase-1